MDVQLRGTLDVSGFAGFTPDREVAVRGLFDVAFSFDLERLAGWRGAGVTAQYYAFAGRNGSGILGDLQGFSNIDADPLARVGEVSLDARWWGERLLTRAGRLDANADFALPVSTDLFQHATAGYSAAIFPMPTYPAPKPGVVVAYHAAGPLVVTGGVYAGPSMRDLPDVMTGDGRMWMLQTAIEDAERGRRVAVGAWRHSGQFVTASEESEHATGWFALAEGTLGRSGGRAVVGSVQAAGSNSYASPVNRHLAMGVRVEHLSNRRPHDVMGARVSFAHVPAHAVTSGSAYEQAWEVFHRFVLHPRLSLQPDAQYIRLHGAAAQPHRVAFTLRFITEF